MFKRKFNKILLLTNFILTNKKLESVMSTKIIYRYFLITLACILITNNSFAQDRKYVGASKCKTCHKKASQGEQYKIWKASAHAKAYETLGTEKAKKYGKKRGIDNPQQSEKCLKCHVTAYNVDKKLLGKKYDKTQGVGCESCHGAGGDYYKKKTMKKLFAGKIKPESVGLTLPTEKVCLDCHNDESPSFQGFDYDKYFEKIKHPIPEGKKQ